MPSITKKQYIAWNSKMGNGFTLDLQNYVAWGEKTAKVRIETADGGFWDVSVRFQKEATYKLTSYGKDQLQKGIPYNQCNGWNEWTGNYYPVINIQHYAPSTVEGVYHSDSAHKSKRMGDVSSRRNFSTIQKLTHQINAVELINELFPDEMNSGHEIKAA